MRACSPGDRRAPGRAARAAARPTEREEQHCQETPAASAPGESAGWPLRPGLAAPPRAPHRDAGGLLRIPPKHKFTFTYTPPPYRVLLLGN